MMEPALSSSRAAAPGSALALRYLEPGPAWTCPEPSRAKPSLAQATLDCSGNLKTLQLLLQFLDFGFFDFVKMIEVYFLDLPLLPMVDYHLIIFFCHRFWINYYLLYLML